jgi:glycosidase
MIVALAVLAACNRTPECYAPDCEVPETPWDPGSPAEEGGGGSGYGYGDTDTDPGTEPELPREILTVRSCDVTIRYPDDGRAVQVAGTFNGWTPVSLTGPDEDGVLSASLGALAPGVYGYKLLFDGVFESAPPENVYTMWDDGSENRALYVGDCDVPLLQTVSASATPDGRVAAVVQVALAADEAPVDPSSVTVRLGDEVVPAEVGADGLIEVDVSGLPAGKHSLRVWAADTSGRRAENEPLFVPLWVEDEAFDWRDGLMYFAFVDRFRNGDWGEAPLYPDITTVTECADYQGGDYLGVIHAIEEGYFDELGVRTIWLSPSYENPDEGFVGADGVHWFSGYHGYWPIDPLYPESRLGDVEATSDERLRELVAVAHEHGIRVLFDLVLNHVHEDHVYADEHPEWFGDGCVCGTTGCGWEEKPVECWFTEYLPDLNYKNPDVTSRVLDDTMRLIETYDVDAVRIDAAKHMDHVIMRSLSLRLRDTYEAGGGAEFYLVGETFTGDHGLIMDYVGDAELDGQYDFPLYFTLREVFVNGQPFTTLEGAVATGESFWGDAVMSPFIGNHDVERFATDVTGAAGDCWTGWLDDPMRDGGSSINQWDLINKASMALAFVMTQPGVPLLYYGDEIGLHGAGDPDNRRLMSFAPYLSANQDELLGRVQAISKARQASPAIRYGARRQLWVEGDLYVYARDAGGGEAAIIAMNRGGSRTLSVSAAGLGLEGATLTSAVSARTITVGGDGSFSLTLDPWEYAIFLP